MCAYICLGFISTGRAGYEYPACVQVVRAEPLTSCSLREPASTWCSTEVGQVGLFSPPFSVPWTANSRYTFFFSCTMDAGRYDYTGRVRLCLIRFFENLTPSHFLAAISLPWRPRTNEPGMVPL
jgi:hypothetical protein